MPSAQRIWRGIGCLLTSAYYGFVFVTLMAGVLFDDVRYDYGVRHEGWVFGRLSLNYAGFVAGGLLPGIVMLAVSNPGRFLTGCLFVLSAAGIVLGLLQSGIGLPVWLPYLVLSGWMAGRRGRRFKTTQPPHHVPSLP